MSIADEWVRAFARQADADFRAWELYDVYPEAVAAECHRMHFLQMACEKLCKACVLDAQIVTLDKVQTSHGFVKSQLSTILKQELSYKREKSAQIKTVMQHFKRFAQEIEVLNARAITAAAAVRSSEASTTLTGDTTAELVLVSKVGCKQDLPRVNYAAWRGF